MNRKTDESTIVCAELLGFVRDGGWRLMLNAIRRNLSLIVLRVVLTIVVSVGMRNGRDDNSPHQREE